MDFQSGTGLIGFEATLRAIVSKMRIMGFDVIAVGGASSSTVPASATNVVLKATSVVDPLVADQPWVVVLDASDASKYLDVYVLPENQLTASYSAPARDETKTVGKLSVDSETERRFIHLVDEWGMDETTEFAATPIGFTLHSTDHGFAMHIHSESRDWSGMSFSWMVVQRGVETPVVPPAGSTSPLFCVYSAGGGQQGNPDVMRPTSVQRFTVIEADLFAATEPVSAVVATPDNMPIINPLQQVALMKGNRVAAFFPQAINTHRHIYFLKLDMLAYTSADVIAMSSEVPLMPNNEQVYFRAGCANGSDNRGMRVMFPVRLKTD